MSKKTETLENRMKIITHNLPHLHSVSISLNFKIGSLYENEENNGITHLCEHLFFRQLNNLSQNELYLKMQMLGCEMTGKTSTDYVSFKMKVVPEFFKEAIELIIKILDDFSWNDKTIKEEKRVVLKQIENKSYSFENWIDQYYFENNKHAMPIMGNEKTVENLTSSEINAWKNKYFTCSNACLIVTGNYDKEYFEAVKNSISKLPKVEYTNELIIELPQNFCNRNNSNRFYFSECSDDKCEVVVFFDINNNTNYETMRLLTSILCEGCGSKLGIAMREENAVTDEIYSRLTSHCDFSRLYISYTVHKKLLYKSLEIFFDTVNQIKQNISQDEYLSSINFFTKNQIFNLDDSNALNYNYLIDDFVFNNTISEPQKLKEIYEKISIDDLLACANNVLCKNNLSLLIETSKNIKKAEKKINDILKRFD
ncbi:MAG: pitrilysin family protein [Acutalibacteraceae bacterium]|nr:pitrilysin family protein [Acutalibacteraceae bacterium]